MLLRNFRRRNQGKLALQWQPQPFVVLGHLCPGMPVLRIRPEGGGPERTIHRNNVRPCPYAVPHPPLETDSSEPIRPDDPQVPQLPNADWRNYTWYPVYAPVAALAHRESATSPEVQPNRGEGEMGQFVDLKGRIGDHQVGTNLPEVR